MAFHGALCQELPRHWLHLVELKDKYIAFYTGTKLSSLLTLLFGEMRRLTMPSLRAQSLFTRMLKYQHRENRCNVLITL